MAELSFEQKVQGLQDYYRALTELDPRNPEHSDVANPEFFYYADGHHASHPLQEVKSGVVFDIECHGRVEYGRRGLNAKDLREDTDELRAERADVLAVMTAPLTQEVRDERAERIAGLLSSISRGETLRLTPYDTFHRRYEAPQDAAADIGRSLFGVFRNGHVSSRTLTIQYDSPVTFAPTDDVEVGEPLMHIEVPDLFKTSWLSGAVKLQAETVAA